MNTSQADKSKNIPADKVNVPISINRFTWHGDVAVSGQGMQDHLGARSAD